MKCLANLYDNLTFSLRQDFFYGFSLGLSSFSCGTFWILWLIISLFWFQSISFLSFYCFCREITRPELFSAGFGCFASDTTAFSLQIYPWTAYWAVRRKVNMVLFALHPALGCSSSRKINESPKDLLPLGNERVTKFKEPFHGK